MLLTYSRCITFIKESVVLTDNCLTTSLLKGCLKLLASLLESLSLMRKSATGNGKVSEKLAAVRACVCVCVHQEGPRVCLERLSPDALESSTYRKSVNPMYLMNR